MNTNKPCHFRLDSHVHFYDCWNISLDQLLTTAHDNLSPHNIEDTTQPTYPAICLLDTEKRTVPLQQKLNLADGLWQKENIALETYSFWFRKNEKAILVITGTQINTDEGLEVLVIGNQDNIAHGMPIKTLLQQQESRRLNIIPWAAGKWLSRRGELLTELLENQDQYSFVLGDNAGRPWLWKNIKQLEYANSHGIPILCGSDPLPLHKHYLKSGSYGNLIETSSNLEKPWTSIIQAIQQQAQLNKFGHLCSVSGFVLNQVKLRL